MSAELGAAIAVNRFGLGARPGELARVGDGQQWLRAQLRGPAPLLIGAGLQRTADILAGAAALQGEAREAKRAAAKLGPYYRPIYEAEAEARLSRAVLSDAPFAERLVHFWSNHFAVSVDKASTLGIAGSMEREAIRPHVFGNFREMLLAVEQHPAMLLFLDNPQSVGPHSRGAVQVARRRRRELGLNENLAREILELHTLGVDGGYSQQDVTNFARVITGWSVYGPRGKLLAAFGTTKAQLGEYVFREQVHEPGTELVLGRRYDETGEQQGIAVLNDLAVAPATAKHIATKLARHFIADDPPAAAIERIASAFARSRGDLPTTYTALIDAPESWLQPLAKYKTPTDYIVSLYRGLELPVPEGRKALAPFELLGQRQFSPGSPAGWPDRGADWDGAAALMRRIEFVDALALRLGSGRNAAALAPQLLGSTLSAPTAQSIARAASGAQALTLLLASPEFLRR